MRVWQGVGRTRKRKQEFQLTHPWWCDRRNYSDSVELPNFNSHTREGVTTAMCMSNRPNQFQLTHPWGCDCCAYKQLSHSTNFNSHTREGVTTLLSRSIIHQLISTHTPVRVWLHGGIQHWPEDGNFNSHTREGVTAKFFISLHLMIFQLTHPWGCDRFRPCISCYILHFNSHTREGVTNFLPLFLRSAKISTHTPVRVWLFSTGGKIFDGIISTHTPVRVWLAKQNYTMLDNLISTHTPVRVWHSGQAILEVRLISTHTPVRVWPRA